MIALVAGTTASPADEIDALRWKARLLVVAAPAPDDPRLAEQRRIYERARNGARERDLHWIEAVGQRPEAEALRRRFGLDGATFSALLVGKDGGAKISSSEPIAARRLFTAIDAMPMRREEMRRAGQ